MSVAQVINKNVEMPRESLFSNPININLEYTKCTASTFGSKISDYIVTLDGFWPPCEKYFGVIIDPSL